MALQTNMGKKIFSSKYTTNARKLFMGYICRPDQSHLGALAEIFSEGKADI
jgi:hypothetical protein